MRATFILSLFREDIVRALFWTLIHSLWQGMALAILTGLVILFTRKSVPALRYNVFLGLFCLSLAAAGVTFFLQLRGVHAGSDGPAVVPVNVAPAPPVETLVMSNLYAGVEQPWTGRLVNYLDQRADVMVAIWMIILFIRLVKLLTDLGAVQRLRYYRTRAVDESWRRRVGELAQRMRIKRVVELLESSLIQVPMMSGIFKPVILVPLGLLSQLPPQQVEAILLHELAHIRRKDYIINLLQSVAEIIFFFNPAMLWISSLIREERENCCDDIAVGESCSKKEFIHALVSFQEYRQSSSYALAFPGSKNHLLDRVKRIIHNDNKTLNVREKLFVLMSVFITAGLTMAYFRQSPVPAKPGDAQVKAAGIISSWNTAYVDTPAYADTLKPGQSQGAIKRNEAAADTTVIPEQRREWERALAEQQRRLEEAQARLAEQAEELARQQDRLNDLYAEALTRVQDLRDSVNGEGRPLALLREEQLQLAHSERLLKENQLKAENLARLQERSLQMQQREWENQARLQERNLQNQRREWENQARVQERNMENQRREWENQARVQERNMQNQQREREKQAMLQEKQARAQENLARVQELALQRSQHVFESATQMGGHMQRLGEGSDERMNKYTAPVIEMLQNKKLITRTDELSFSLDKDGLTVNGKKQPDGVFQEFRKAFLEDPQDYIRYSKKGASESASVNKHRD
jgi:beta-lactamase regulating signal transducer with metallopeptidase domain